MRTERSTVSAFDLDQARRGGKSIYPDRVRPDPRYPAARQDAARSVLNHLIKCGTILETAFDLDSAGTLEDEPSNRLLLEVLVCHRARAYSLSQILDVPPERVHRIENNGVDHDAMVATLKRRRSSGQTAAAPPAIRRSGCSSRRRRSRPSADAIARREPRRSTKPQLRRPVTAQAETTIRLNVGLLDSLMTLAGELVLGRNQLNEAVAQRGRSRASARAPTG